VYRLPECVEFLPPFVGGENAARGGQDVRVDSGVREGDVISPFYDSMVAKLIVHGDTREQALARMDAALAATRIVGLATNVQFLRHVVGSRSFSQADLDTALIPREADVLFKQEKVGLPLAVAAAVAQTLLAERAGEGADPFSRRDSWRSHGAANRRFDFEFKGEVLIAQLVSCTTACWSAVGRPSGCCSSWPWRAGASNCGRAAPDACRPCAARRNGARVRDAMVPRASWRSTPWPMPARPRSRAGA
jgi:hypothetical protein